MKRSQTAGFSPFAAGVVATVALDARRVIVVAYSGSYNVATTEEHASFTRSVFDTTFRRSLESRAAAETVPSQISDAMLATGAGEHREYCRPCHAEPRVERTLWSSGMRPRPPHLREAAAHCETAEIFWPVKHRAKMSGMPAFGPGDDDETLWGIAAFVKQLPATTPEQYAAAGCDLERSGDGSAKRAVRPETTGDE